MNDSLNTGFIVANTQTGEWFFCPTAQEVEQIPNAYRFDGADQIQSQSELIDALAHLGKKPWFKPEAFFDCLCKL